MEKRGSLDVPMKRPGSSGALFIVIKYESVHADGIALLDPRFFNICKDPGLL